MNIFDQLEDLCNKYIKEGLLLSIEFNQFGMIIRGYQNDFCFNRMYDYDLLRNLSISQSLVYREIVVDYLVDEFKKEFDKEVSKCLNTQ